MIIMPDYSQGKIYKISSPNFDKCYVGSTCAADLKERLWGHRTSHNNYKAGKYHYITSFAILEAGNATIELLEECPCDNKEELRKCEQKYIDEFGDVCVNKSPAYKSPEQKAERDRKYKEDNADRIRERRRRYKEANKEAIRLKNQAYYEAHREDRANYRAANRELRAAKQREYSRLHAEEIRAKRRVSQQCACGMAFTIYHKGRHETSKKHQDYLASIVAA